MKKYLAVHETYFLGAVDRHPFFTMIFGQIAVALLLIMTVGGIALAGGTLIWLIYRALGIM